ncbi:MAG: phage tail sheath C-terminal domain-containing protein [Pseudomonadota bacterium]
MPGQYLHGVEVIEMPMAPSINSVDSSVIGLIGILDLNKTTVSAQKTEGTNDDNQGGQVTEDKKDPNNKFYKEPYLVTSIDNFFNHFGENSTGTLVETLQDIYSQVVTKVVVAPIKTKDDIAEGIKLLEKSAEKLKVGPKILVAPELTTNSSEVKELANKLVEAAKKLKAVALVDLIAEKNELAEIQAATNDLAQSDRLYLLYPNVIVKRKNKKEDEENKEIDTVRPASAFVAGLMVKSDNERGYWYSPSNYKLSNISGLAEEIDFTLGDANCLANDLNKININTIIWQGGYRLWGNKSYIKEGPDKNFEFLPVRRTADVLNMSLLENHMWAIDQTITKNLIDTIVDSVNAFIRKLKLQGAIINGKCWADLVKNTADSLTLGHFYINFDFSAPYPAERITFQSFITKDYLNEALA